jgi:hypothetical protein
MESGNAKSVKQELGAKLQAREKTVDDLSAKVKMLEDLYHSRLVQPEVSKDRAFEPSSSSIGSDISEIEDLVSPFCLMVLSLLLLLYILSDKICQ